jgi:hypothetical protein
MSAFKRAAERNEKPKWEDLPSELRKSIPTNKTDALMCYGCKSDTIFIGCSKCLIRKCAKDKMQVETCFQCTRFPCVRYRIFSFIRKLMQKRLPHIRSAYANQACIQDKGIATWLSEQEEQWKCSKCKTGFSWCTKTCTLCGNDLDFQRRF